jgi:S1-C subfamily serine protease
VLTKEGRVGIGTASPVGRLDVVGGTIEFDPGSERARIDSSGRLLVGASANSGGALLQVNGDRIRVATAKTPASATDTGTAGEICWDADYIYVCTATNTWKRTAISTW